jgi:hypothetical protein
MLDASVSRYAPHGLPVERRQPRDKTGGAVAIQRSRADDRARSVGHVPARTVATATRRGSRLEHDVDDDVDEMNRCGVGCWEALL